MLKLLKLHKPNTNACVWLNPHHLVEMCEIENNPRADFPSNTRITRIALVTGRDVCVQEAPCEIVDLIRSATA